MLLRSFLVKHNLTKKISTSSSKLAAKSAKEKPFPKLEVPLKIQNEEQTLSKSKKAEEQYFKALFTCQAGGGEKGMQKHVVNKACEGSKVKVLVHIATLHTHTDAK